MANIVKTAAREILDSRGNPTVEVDIILNDGTLAGRLFHQCIYRPSRSL